MFRQVSINPSQWDLQRIFWRESQLHPLEEYWLTVVTYGMTSSSHNSVRAMIQCARDYKHIYPRATYAIESDFYMDDVLTGAESENELELLCREIDVVLKKGGFTLRHWISNSRGIQETMRSERKETVTLSELDKTKVLGLRWLANSDDFAITVKPGTLPANPTKRMVLGEIARMYDPNGFVAPIVIVAKMFMQDLWRENNLSWDDRLPDQLRERWQKFHSEIKSLEEFRIPRWIRLSRNAVSQLHGFCDSSSKAYGAVLYVRTVDCSGLISCSLLMAKSRVAPLLTTSIPRLELQAAEMLGRLFKRAVRICELAGVQYFLWSDSTIVLHWLKKSPYDLKTFVANRVASIQSNTSPIAWAHVRSEDNPADLISRGLSVQEFLNNRMWLNGPAWLSQAEEDWPKPKLCITQEHKKLMANECKLATSTFIGHVLHCGNIDLLDKFSNWMKILRITAYVFRFVNNSQTKQHGSGHCRPPDHEELRNAAIHWIKCVQAEHYKGEIIAIENKHGELPQKTTIASLRPFLDKDHVLRAGGRIDKADCTYEQRHPMIIPPKSRLCWLILNQAHIDTMHGGAQLMMRYVQNFYWIPKLRSNLKTFISYCVRCVRESKKISQQIMSDLPMLRVRPARAFAKTGVDMAGPYHVRVTTKLHGNTRSRAHDLEVKGYVAVFVCLVTRAVHLEAVEDMSSQAFLSAYNRFVARRGICDYLYSGNGTNFKGANNEMQRILLTWQSKAVQEKITWAGTTWRFITPAAPHEGGLWESAVKSIKHHLRRVIGTQKYSYEGIATLLAGVEAYLNSRPICAMQRPKWRNEQNNIKIGQLVLIANENYPPTYWIMGRIQKVLPGDDGCVRKAIIKISGGELERSIRKLCVLPVDDELEHWG